MAGIQNPSRSESQSFPCPCFGDVFKRGEGWEGALQATPASSQQPPPTASTDPLERPLAGQDTFFLEQTKKKGVKVRPWQQGVLGSRSEEGCGGGSCTGALEPWSQPVAKTTRAGARPRAGSSGGESRVVAVSGRCFRGVSKASLRRGLYRSVHWGRPLCLDRRAGLSSRSGGGWPGGGEHNSDFGVFLSGFTEESDGVQVAALRRQDRGGGLLKG